MSRQLLNVITLNVDLQAPPATVYCDAATQTAPAAEVRQASCIENTLRTRMQVLAITIDDHTATVPGMIYFGARLQFLTRSHRSSRGD